MQLKGTTRHSLLAYYILSTIVVLLCVLGAATFLAKSFVEKDSRRAEILKSHLLVFFEFQYQKITEEMWTRNFESIRMRVQQVASQLGSQHYDLILYDKEGNCRFVADSLRRDLTCGSRSKTAIDWTKNFSAPKLSFDERDRLHVYEARLEIGEVKLGLMRARFADPYEFLVGDEKWIFAVKTFLPIAFASIILWLTWVGLSRRLFVRPYLNAYGELLRKESLVKFATQVAHDIRSPIETLDVLTRNLDFDPERKRIIDATIGRVKDIANGLLILHRDDRGTSTEIPNRVYLLNSLVDQIVSEKRTRFRHKAINFDVHYDSPALFGSVNRITLSRSLSNIIDNAAEASPHGGLVSIEVNLSNENFCLTVKDDGGGIPAEILKLLGKEAIASAKVDGTGIGLFNASQDAIRWGGKLTVSSVEGKGTIVTLEAPISKPPGWFCEEISILDGQKIIVADDEPAIHEIWKERLKLLANFSQDNVIHIYALDELERVLGGQSSNALFLVDFEFSGSTTTGLDVLERFQPRGQVVLVTSRDEEPLVQERCERAGIRLLPKSVIGSIPITHAPKKVDAILVDDDIWVRDAWRLEAARNGKHFAIFSSPQALKKVIGQFSNHTPCFVDYNLQGESGELITKYLNQLGFNNLYLATGMAPEKFLTWDWLTGVVGKDVPLWLIESNI